MRLATVSTFLVVLLNSSSAGWAQSQGNADLSTPVPGASTGAQSGSADRWSAPVLSPLPALRTTITVPIHSEPVAATLDRSKGQDWHKSTLSLVGSMCVTCLMKLEHELGEIPGVAYIKIDRPASSIAETEAEKKTPAVPRAATTTIIYDNQSVKFDRILSWMKREKYKAVSVQDTEYR